MLHIISNHRSQFAQLYLLTSPLDILHLLQKGLDIVLLKVAGELPKESLQLIVLDPL